MSAAVIRQHRRVLSQLYRCGAPSLFLHGADADRGTIRSAEDIAGMTSQRMSLQSEQKGAAWNRRIQSEGGRFVTVQEKDGVKAEVPCLCNWHSNIVHCGCVLQENARIQPEPGMCCYFINCSRAMSVQQCRDIIKQPHSFSATPINRRRGTW